jgi:LPXTG-motif cell wall-anchored protein
MSEEFSDDFVIEEEDTANRSFLIAAGSLIGVFILLSACLLVYVLMQRTETQDEVALIEAQNATTQAQNALVTQTVEAIETQQALVEIEAERATAEAESLNATMTVEAIETLEAIPTETPTPTEVVQQPSPTATNTPIPTLVLGGGGDGDGAGALATPITPGAGETLPQTGINVWGIALVGLGLLALLIVARRLRTN